jgi:hypothetical protein
VYLFGKIRTDDLVVALASQVLFQRSLLGLDIATGKVPVTGDYATNGTASATHAESFVPLVSS